MNDDAQPAAADAAQVKSQPTLYTFLGRVHPERCALTLPEFHFQLRSGEHETLGEARCHIAHAQISVSVLPSVPITEFFTLKNQVEECVQAVIDAYGFTVACAYRCEIVQMVDSIASPPMVFGVEIPAIANFARDADIDARTVLNLFMDPRGRYLQRCLADLREAIRAPGGTGFFCYRGIEALRQYFLQERGAKNDGESWEMLRAELRTERADIEVIKGFADPIRHGAGRAISDAERARVFTLTWNVAISFIKYATAGYRNPQDAGATG